MLLVITIATAGAADWSGTLPVMHINTIGGMPITSKETYVKATYYVDALGIGGTQSRYHGVGIVAIGTIVRHFTVSAQRVEDERGLATVLSEEWREKARNTVNPYYQPDTLEKMVNAIMNTPLEGITMKHFHDIKQ